MNSNVNKITNKNKSNDREHTQVITKLKSLSVDQRACFYILIMGVIGTIVGGINAEVKLKKCPGLDNCLTLNLDDQQISEIGIGALAGMGAATFLSLPALLNENN